ncbi:MAG: VOC family protein [Acidimicrobiia bacterium]|nr:VOC family protein [Acidimicrobiia bacterium]
MSNIDTPIAKFGLVALDCPDPRGLAEFYRGIVGGRINDTSEADGWIRLVTDTGSDIGFQLDPDHEPPGWPDGSSQQAHLDFDVSDLDAAEQQLLALGAIKTETQPEPNEWRVFLDPAGHPFCICKV